MSNREFVMLSGLPGSGKSTYVKIYKIMFPNTKVISLDQMIEATMSPGESYAEAFQRVQHSGELKELDKRLFENAEAMANSDDSFDVIWDQTNLTRKTRERKLNYFKHWNNPVCIVFDMSPEELNIRFAKRKEETGKDIPSHVLEEMRKSFEMPSTDEGFTSVFSINERGDINILG